MLHARREIVRMAFSELGLLLTDAVQLADCYSAVCMDKMYVFPDTIETLSSLRRSGLRLALITNGNSDIQRGKISRFGLTDYFDCILIEGEIGFGKPDERVFRRALREVESAPERAVMVGDNLKWDIAGPQAVGMRAIWYDLKGRFNPILKKP